MTPGGFTQTTRWGELLWHPHSTILGALVELGVIGMLPLLLSLGLVLVAAVCSLRHHDPRVWVAGCALLATAPGMLLDTYLLRGFPATLLWWVVALAVGASTPRRVGDDQSEATGAAAIRQ